MDSDKMNIQTACDLLEIYLDQIELSELTHDYVKKQYYKMALKWHPDKTNYVNNVNSIDTTNKFQKINEAYEYLLNELCELNNINKYSDTSETFVSSSHSKESKIYINILITFISSIIEGSYNEVFINIIKEIVTDYHIITLTSLRKIFKELDKENAIEIYNLLYKYKDIFCLREDTLELVSLIVKEKYKNDRVFVLNPSLHDLMESNIYKLYVDGQLYLVPLWHNELYFDAEDGTEIIVLCQPMIDENITIDENNNISITLCINIEKELGTLLKNDKFVSCKIGEKVFSIPISKLFIKEEQTYTFKEQGISHVSEKDIYNISKKSDIIIKIKLI
jgi:hypothetical protein